MAGEGFGRGAVSTKSDEWVSPVQAENRSEKIAMENAYHGKPEVCRKEGKERLY